VTERSLVDSQPSPSPASHPPPRRSFSYDGADLICANLLRNVENGVYVDAGANHPTLNNNTYAFYERGWSGLAIDGAGMFADQWRDARPRDTFVCSLISDARKSVRFTQYIDHTLSTVDGEAASRYAARFTADDVTVETRETETLDALRRSHLGDREAHLLSVDVEGEDLNCLIGARLDAWRPGVVVAETKHLSPYHVRDNAIVQYMTGHGYRLIAKTPLDAFFVWPEKPYLDWIPSSIIAI